jgi:hypothetical protein
MHTYDIWSAEIDYRANRVRTGVGRNRHRVRFFSAHRPEADGDLGTDLGTDLALREVR